MRCVSSGEIGAVSSALAALEASSALVLSAAAPDFFFDAVLWEVPSWAARSARRRMLRKMPPNLDKTTTSFGKILPDYLTKTGRIAQEMSFTRGWAGLPEFIEPERNPSVSRVTKVNPSDLKMRVNSRNISVVRARC